MSKFRNGELLSFQYSNLRTYGIGAHQKRILLDMDDVLVPWRASVQQLMNRSYDEMCLRHGTALDRSWWMGDEMWQCIREQGEEWWSGLGKFPWTDDLFEMAQRYCGDNWYIVTAGQPVHCPSSYYGKIEWARRNMKVAGKLVENWEHRIVVTSSKNLCANVNTLLIDDRKENCLQFAEHGGNAIHFPSDPNWHTFLTNHRMSIIEYVESRIYKCLKWKVQK